MSKPLLPARPLPGPLVVVSLTPVQRQNLLGFLQRSTLSGKEAQAFTEVFDLVRRAAPENLESRCALAPNQQSAITHQQSTIP